MVNASLHRADVMTACINSIQEICRANLGARNLKVKPAYICRKFLTEYNPIYARMILAQILVDTKWIRKDGYLFIPNPYYNKPADQLPVAATEQKA